MSLSRKDGVNPYLVNTGTRNCIPWTLINRSKKSADAERIMELEKKQVELESRLAEKTISYNNELVELKKKQVELESIIEKKNELFYDTQIREDMEFQKVKTKLNKQLLEKQEEINDLAAHLYVLNNEVDKYLSNEIDKKRLENTIVFMKKRMLKINISRDHDSMKAIENIWDALIASREQQQKEEAQNSAMLHD
jgi:hypothetical protein